MIFNTLTFAIFLVITLGAYWSLREDVWRRRLLFVANLFFYGWWDWRFVPLLLGVIIVSYFSAHLIQKARTPGGSKFWLAAACVLQLGILGYFKYANFFIGALQEAVERAGGHAGWTSLHIILPVGISFYIFQGISYVASVYEKRLTAEENFVKLGVYLAFFPHLVAGPIIHATFFLPQLAERRRFDVHLFFEGAKKFATGFLYKTVFADNLGAFVDPIFRAPAEHAPIVVFGGSLGFYGQIYFDFAGYSLMAIGVANFFGYLLPDNFNHPYRATSMIDFWRRWHISLSTWLRDYLYIPLGGNRGSKWFQYRNILITMLLGGLWHGASWNFIWWGAIHGLALCVNHAWRDWRSRGREFRFPAPVAWLGSLLLTQAVVFLCWIPFRAQSFGDTMTILSSLGQLLTSSWTLAVTLPWLLLVIPLLVDTWIIGNKPLTARFSLRSNVAVYALILLAMLTGLLFMHLGKVPFIYFQF
jgi:D-alanyl-lipoteichoic acid acyltransferase DltB (MBOAT superfamily)